MGALATREFSDNDPVLCANLDRVSNLDALVGQPDLVGGLTFKVEDKFELSHLSSLDRQIRFAPHPLHRC